MKKRKLNYELANAYKWPNAFVSKNIYAVSCAIALRDEDQQLSVFTNRPMGGTSLYDSKIELFQNRRLLGTD